ncbi:MAG: AMP-binding protein [Gammaproteobacteria bacterium]|nr:AMP-binding protein [Gammaproteobacteria bacterium]
MLVELLKFVVGTIFRLAFPVRITGLENYHAAGKRVLIVVNHLSLLDGILLYLFLPDRLTFAINPLIADRWYFRPFFWFTDLFRMDPLNPLAVKALIKYLREDRRAVIFPEGRITYTGSLMKIYEGPGLIADKAEATVLPISLDGPQYSLSSYLRGLVKRRWLPPITIKILAPRRIEPPTSVQGQERRDAVFRTMTRIMREIGYEAAFRRQTIFAAVLDAMDRHGPRQPVIEDSDRVPLTFRQLVARSFILGRAMAQVTARGEAVGILLPNSNAAAVTFLALQAYGRVPAMLNFTAGQRGLQAACETGRIKRIYTSRKFVEAADLRDVVTTLQRFATVTLLEDLRSEIGAGARLLGMLRAYFPRHAHRAAAGQVDCDAPACMLFTSGSEGLPKGVVLSHTNLLANRAQVQTLIDLTPRDVFFNALPIFHCFGLIGLLLAMLNGARTFLYPTPLHYRIIPELCYALRATCMFGTNTFLAGYAKYADPFDFRSMRYVVAGAEKLHDETRRTWADKFGIRVLEGYGATEASPVVSVNTPHCNKVGTVGQLVAGIDYYLAPVQGLARGGRLVIRGPNIMLGYMLHAAPGEISPPATDRGLGWYDTGDIVAIDEDGFVTILGRAKRFAKVGGEMVSLSFVEELAANAWPGIKHAAVSIPDERKGEQIILLTEYAQPDRKDLVAAAQRLGATELAIPRRLIQVTEIPVLGTGKLNYQAIQDLARSLVV